MTTKNKIWKIHTDRAHREWPRRWLFGTTTFRHNTLRSNNETSASIRLPLKILHSGSHILITMSQMTFLVSGNMIMLLGDC